MGAARRAWRAVERRQIKEAAQGVRAVRRAQAAERRETFDRDFVAFTSYEEFMREQGLDVSE